MDDKWKHRAKGMKCKTCMWFVPKENIGRCRRRAPTMNGYPVVFPADWCGDHKLNEVKREELMEESCKNCILFSIPTTAQPCQSCLDKYFLTNVHPCFMPKEGN